MVGVVEHDDGRTPGVGAGDLHGVLDGLGPGGEQRGALLVVAGGQPVQRLGHADDAVVLGDHEAGVGEPRRLVGHGAGHLGGGGADAGDRDAGGQVDQPVAVDVDQQRALRVVDEHGEDHSEAPRQRPLPSGVQLAGARAGDLGAQHPAGGCCGRGVEGHPRLLGCVAGRVAEQWGSADHGRAWHSSASLYASSNGVTAICHFGHPVGTGQRGGRAALVAGPARARAPGPAPARGGPGPVLGARDRAGRPDPVAAR